MPSKPHIPHEAILGDICAMQSEDSTMIVLQTLDGLTWFRSVTSKPDHMETTDWQSIHEWHIDHYEDDTYLFMRHREDDPADQVVLIDQFFMIPRKDWREIQETSEGI